MKYLDEIVKRLFPGEFPWRVTADDKITGATEIVIRPKVYRSVSITREELEALGTSGLVEWLYHRINGNRASICDELDRSIGRERRLEGPTPCGKCKYCGAPYGP